MRLLPLLAAAAAVTACATAPATALAPPPASGAVMKAPDGRDIGEVAVQQVPQGVVISIEVRGLAPGWHGVHIHDVSNCTAPAFTSAGAHVHQGPTREHGFLTASGGEYGDLPNLWVGADGVGKAQFFSDRVSLTEGQGRLHLWDADGSSIVVHEKQDDHYSQPIGNSGARVACGALVH